MRKKGAKKNDVRENIRIMLEKYDRQHLLNQVKRKKNIDMIYDELCKEAARLGKQTNFNDPDAPFYFSDYPETQKKIDQLIAKHASKIQTHIEQGDEDEWMLSVSKNNAMIGMLTAGTKIPEATLKTWKQPHLDALAAFQQRKQNGMGLSERVWNLSQQTKQELELALDIGLGEGKSAAELSRDVRKFLNEPHKLFRRVRDKHGVLRLSKAARAYHPGQGVYRSSYKNAIRMTGTENNMAYRTADHEKWGKLDFVIGIEIRLSNNHTLNGKPFHDICDEMAGKYPKDFKFTGWHPQCRCFAIPILADWEEQLKVMDMQDAGEDLSDYHYAGEVTEMPEGYKDWMENNAERIANAKSLPYFIKDNPEYAAQASGVDVEAKMGKQEAIKDAGAHKYGDNKKHVIVKEDEILALYDKPQNGKPIEFTEEQKTNNIAIAQILRTKQQEPMPHHVANSGNVNPDTGFVGSKDNCALCSFTYELRRRGFNVKAKLLNPMDKSSDAWTSGEDYTKLWKGLETSVAEATRTKSIITALNNATKEGGRYCLAWDWNSNAGHNIVAERLADGNLVLYDSQKRKYRDINTYFTNVKKIDVYKVDKAVVNIEEINLKDIVEKVTFKKRGR